MIKTLGIISVGALSISSAANLSATTMVSAKHSIKQSDIGKSMSKNAKKYSKLE